MSTTKNPPIDVPAIDPNNGQFVPDWYDRFKYLDGLQPLSEIVFPAAGVTSIDGVAGAFTLSYPLSRSSQALLAALTSVTASLGADVLLNNTANYFDGPSVTLGPGTWVVMATVLLLDTGATATINIKLWDGTTVISSTALRSSTTVIGNPATVHGIITNPAAAVRASCQDVTATTGKILFNSSGNSKDSHITAVRIA